MYLFMVSFYIAVIIAITDGMFLMFQKLYKRLYVSFILNNYEVVTIIHSLWVMRLLGLSYRPKVIWALNGEARINWASHTELVDMGGGPLRGSPFRNEGLAYRAKSLGFRASQTWVPGLTATLTTCRISGQYLGQFDPYLPQLEKWG